MAVSVGVLILAIGTYLLRLVGPFMGRRVQITDSVDRVITAAAVTLLTAVVVTNTLYESGSFAGWSRVAGVAVGSLCTLLRAPFVVIIIAAAAATALLRWFGMS